ncbi:hypothetical protein MPTK1_6g11450 [Marchantia polymorpha subsp. ruderalis]|uniref:Uncharacterized protein n=2 Tax=Marchantia polymorpha TaxID=3197 RepID=A0AAF6BQX7_MARPO|nr:hypothetical protein MARPO_0016s0184 [Marchantia polymorpha]BBN14411.1 hypothetical protein Mp_6g11450 [Marchantia polymorpha subsp. ruderalis]|eukprot:PTQ45144.1 hypothetical protein MARPO_0016s0184 [Marchantia polymorpha]
MMSRIELYRSQISPSNKLMVDLTEIGRALGPSPMLHVRFHPYTFILVEDTISFGPNFLVNSASQTTCDIQTINSSISISYSSIDSTSNAAGMTSRLTMERTDVNCWQG